MPKKILLADDSITIQKVVELTLSDGDYEVIATSNGNRAIQKLAEVRPDLVLSDIIMPEKNGYELCEYIKSHPDYRHIPVILLTGTFEPFDPDRAEKAGCDAVITKPFESQSLIHKVEELIQQSSAAKAAPSPAAPEEKPSAFTSISEGESRGWPPPKAEGWSAPSPPAPPITEKPFAPPPTPAAPSVSAFKEHGEEPSDYSGATKAFPKMSFEELQKAEMPPPEPEPEPQETEIEYSGATKAFPKMSFEDLQQMSGAYGAAAETEGWAPPAEAAPTSEWAAPEPQPTPFAEEQPVRPQPSGSIFEAAPPPPPPTTPAAPVGELSEQQIDRIARRVVELMSDQVVRNIAWEVIPDTVEMMVRERIKQLESEEA